jgi:hypothetical protein
MDRVAHPTSERLARLRARENASPCSPIGFEAMFRGAVDLFRKRLSSGKMIWKKPKVIDTEEFARHRCRLYSEKIAELDDDSH